MIEKCQLNIIFARCRYLAIVTLAFGHTEDKMCTDLKEQLENVGMAIAHAWRQKS